MNAKFNLLTMRGVGILGLNLGTPQVKDLHRANPSLKGSVKRIKKDNSTIIDTGVKMPVGYLTREGAVNLLQKMMEVTSMDIQYVKPKRGGAKLEARPSKQDAGVTALWNILNALEKLPSKHHIGVTGFDNPDSGANLILFLHSSAYPGELKEEIESVPLEISLEAQDEEMFLSMNYGVHPSILVEV